MFLLVLIRLRLTKRLLKLPPSTVEKNYNPDVKVSETKSEQNIFFSKDK